MRTKGGASIYFWSPVISVKCGDKNQPVVPLTDQVPKDIAANVFANVDSVEISEHRAPDFPRVSARRCRRPKEHTLPAERRAPAGTSLADWRR